MAGMDQYDPISKRTVVNFKGQRGFESMDGLQKWKDMERYGEWNQYKLLTYIPFLPFISLILPLLFLTHFLCFG